MIPTPPTQGYRIAVAMSGGVDSSTLAGLLVEAGYQVVGITSRLYDDPCNPSAKSCCTSKDIEDAKAVAKRFGFPHYVMDETDVFYDSVIDPFIKGWEAGTTPNPCVACNRHMKFDPIWDYARNLGCQALATGHYAQVTDGRIRRAINIEKDQAYFLWGVSPATLKHVLFPMGDMTKDEVRSHAERLGIHVAQKRESQDVCFVGKDLKAYLAANGTFKPGDIRTVDGEFVGTHRGLHTLTIGQNTHGLRVLNKQGITNTVIVGEKPDVTLQAVGLRDVVWHGPVPVGQNFLAQIRSRGSLVPVSVVEKDLLAGNFDFKPTPGQSMVLWDGDALVGGGIVV